MNDKLRAWWQAARPLAQANIAVPLLFGTALAYGAAGVFSWELFAVTLVIGVLDQLFIVFANDVADEAGDRVNRTYSPFSGGSRVIPEGKLDAAALRRAAVFMVIGLAGVATYAAAFQARPWMPVGMVAAVGLLWAYSFPPCRLSYRGYGEAAQGVGIGIALPALAYYLQVGTLAGIPLVPLIFALVLGFVGNINTALPDEPADRVVEKLTWPVRFGMERARRHTLGVTALLAVATPFAFSSFQPMGVWLLLMLPAAVVTAINARTWRSADPHDSRACTMFVFRNGLAGGLLLAGWSCGLAFPV